MKWKTRLLACLTVFLLFHVLTLWITPRLIMYKVISTLNKESIADGKLEHFPAISDASSRKIVMPSPDILYSYCVYDLSKGQIHITANPNLSSYWSIAFYADNTDNFYTLNDMQLRTLDTNHPLSIWLKKDNLDHKLSNQLGKNEEVNSPSEKGMVLMRVLAVDYANNQEKLDQARKTLKCKYPIK